MSLSWRNLEAGRLGTGAIRQGLREITTEEVSHIQLVVEQFHRLSRKELARTLCEHLSWFSPSGAPKVSNCLRLLERLADQGMIVLPQKGPSGRLTPDKRPKLTQRTAERPLIKGPLSAFAPVELQAVSDQAQNALWNEYVERYHPLGHRRPFGNWLRYFLSSDGELLGCLLIAGAAKALHHRDRWIGWSVAHRRRNLPWVINNSRYLIFPWVQIPNLASHALGQLARIVARDWQARWGYRPVLMETFVDPEQHPGTCYQAAGWQALGMTRGEGISRPGKHYTTRPKCIYVKPLDDQFRELLCSEQLQGRIIE